MRAAAQTLLHRVRQARDYLRGAPVLAAGPSALMVETTVRCNLRCPMCPRTTERPGSHDMPDAVLWPLLEEHAALGGDHVYLYGLGEPLLDVRIFDVLRRCRELGLRTVLSTNATLLDAPRRAQLLDAGCDHLIASLDAATPETYARYRAGGDFHQTVANVRALAAEKHARSSETTLVLQFVRVAGNLAEQDAFTAMWSGVPGVDLVRLKDEDIGIPEHSLYRPDGWRRRNRCHLLWRGPLVARHDGRVFACYNLAGLDQPLGRLPEQSLAELWASPALQALRTAHARRAVDPASPCGRCPAPRPRLPFILGATLLGGARSRALLPVAERLALRLPGLLQEDRQPAREQP
jgi:MoaA/NifB/PqqE/SkfB family radical SAM enzyme